MFQVCIVDKNNKIVSNLSIKRRDLSRYICSQPEALVVVEAVQRPQIKSVPIKSFDQQDLQSIHRVRERLVKQRTALANQIRGISLEYGVAIPKGIHQLSRQIPEIIENAENELTMRTRELLADLYKELKLLDSRINHYTHVLETEAKQNEACKRLLKLEGIGPIIATAMVSMVGRGDCFTNGRQMAAWLGLVPRQYSSGGKPRLLGISKRGDSYLRKLLIHGARAVIRHLKEKTDSKSRWLRQLVSRAGTNKAAVALANKTVRTAWAILTKGEDYQVDFVLNTAKS
ncbi:MAG: IS110 family transposase [Gammaproteobacteria bacterium]|nr:IS110 family transposase [Gammaproteobacteria bacterium]